MRIYPGTTVDYEFAELRSLGYSGTLNDMQFAALRGEGLTGSLPDMFYQFTGTGGVWVIVATLIEEAPVVGIPSTPIIQDGALLGPAGLYRVVNSTLSTDEEISLTPPVPLDSLGSPGDSLTIYYYAFSSSSPEVDLPAGGYTFQEDWSWLTVGNTWTQVDARYTRSSTTVETPVVTDATAPSGKALQVGATSFNHRWLTEDTLSAELSSRTTEVVQSLSLWRLLSTTNSNGGLGHFAATNQHTGVYIRRFGAADQRVYAQGVGDPSTPTNVSAIAGTYSDDDLVWVRSEVDGNVVRVRSWLDGAGEPGTWTSYTHGSALAFTTCGPMTRSGNPSHQLLYYSVAVDGTAPGS